MGLKQYQAQEVVGGIDFSRVDRGSATNALPFKTGTVAHDQQGQRYVYCKFTAQLAIADIDTASVPVALTKTLPTIAANHDIVAADIDDGQKGSIINGLASDVVAALAANADLVSGVFERRVPGAAADQFAWTPTSTDFAGAWVKTEGIARKVPAPAGLAANEVISRIMSAGALVEVKYTLDGNAGTIQPEPVLGYALEGVDAGGQADIVISVNF